MIRSMYVPTLILAQGERTQVSKGDDRLIDEAALQLVVAPVPCR